MWAAALPRLKRWSASGRSGRVCAGCLKDWTPSWLCGPLYSMQPMTTSGKHSRVWFPDCLQLFHTPFIILCVARTVCLWYALLASLDNGFEEHTPDTGRARFIDSVLHRISRVKTY